MLLLLFTATTPVVVAQKKVHKFKVTKVIPHSADKVWAIVGEDYGAIAKSHPKIIASEYINGTLKAGEGAERICYFNESGSKFVKEQMIDYDPENRTFLNEISQTGRFPLNPDYSKARYKVEEIDANSSRFIFSMEYRTKPAFMGSMAKGKFRKLIEDYAIAIEHHLTTGESVTKENFRQVKKQYKTSTSKR